MDHGIIDFVENVTHEPSNQVSVNCLRDITPRLYGEENAKVSTSYFPQNSRCNVGGHWQTIVGPQISRVNRGGLGLFLEEINKWEEISNNSNENLGDCCWGEPSNYPGLYRSCLRLVILG